MNAKERQARQAIIDACRQMNQLGINQGTSGNISLRWEDHVLITPSGVPYEALAVADIVAMRFDGSHAGALRPSSEWRIHRDILHHREDVNAVVHAHPLYATALAIRGMEIPAVHYMIAAAGGPSVRCAPYATYGSEALSRHALRALEQRHACLLANHGMIATGPSLNKALWLAVELETLARQYVIALTLGGPNILPDAEIERVVEKFRDYGPRPETETG